MPESSLKQCGTDVIVKHKDSGKDALEVKHRAAKPMTMCITLFSHYAYKCQEIKYNYSFPSSCQVSVLADLKNFNALLMLAGNHTIPENVSM